MPSWALPIAYFLLLEVTTSPTPSIALLAAPSFARLVTWHLITVIHRARAQDGINSTGDVFDIIPSLIYPI